MDKDNRKIRKYENIGK